MALNCSRVPALLVALAVYGCASFGYAATPVFPNAYIRDSSTCWSDDVAPVLRDDPERILAAVTPKTDLPARSQVAAMLPRFENRLNAELAILPSNKSQRSELTYSDMVSQQAVGAVADLRNFYSGRSLVWLAGGIGAAAAMANTGFDEHFLRDTYVDNVVLASSDEFYEQLHRPKFLGDGIYTIPAFAIAALAEPLIDDLPFGSETAQWGQRSLRTILVGGPPMLGLQWLTGGGRPDETAESSEWQPLRDNNGVSGHSFMGAIPFISAAKMTDDIWLKAGLYAASTLPGVSRINDDAHYFSQVFLGWWLAYLAETAVDHSIGARSTWQIGPSANGLGITVATQW